MKFLMLLLCLTLVGCGSPGHRSKRDKQEPDFKAKIQDVLDARRNIRTIISRPPRNQAELAGIAGMNPNALIFNAQDFAQRLQNLPLDGCPDDFKTAFSKYVAAWAARAADNPNMMLLADAGIYRPGDNPDNAASQTELTWQGVQAVSTRYGVEAE
jgi:hypothetical protein